MNNYLSYLAICLVIAGSVYAQNTIHFDRFSLEDGLSHIKIKDVAQDADGFLWFATPDGLNRYDGYSFTRFRHEPEDLHSLPANSVNTLFIDRSGTLWIGTFNGYCRFDPVLERFERFSSPSDTSQSDLNSVTAIAQGNDGHLWVAKGMGLYRVDLQTNVETLVSVAQKSDTSISSNLIQHIVQDPFSSGLWLATQSGINYFDTEKNVALPVANNGRYAVDPTQYHLETQLLLEQIIRVTPPLVSLGNISNLADTSFFFTLNKPERVLLTMLGEGDRWRLYDYGRLLTATGKEIWAPNNRKTRAAGGSPKNRLQLEFLDLPPGRYKLHYRSDESHSPGSWNSPSPKLAELWGIHLFRLTGKMERELKRYKNQVFKPRATINNFISKLYADTLRDASGRQRLWVATGAGIARLTLPLT
ncbi:MAG: two-component regulator propeller domain-containing protein, partial [Calditrichota bacterium]